MSVATKINHVLEHGTIYFMRERRQNKCRVGGQSFDNGFRIYGDVKSQQEIKHAFRTLTSYLDQGHSAVVLSKYCGSSTHLLGGVAFILLTISMVVFALSDFKVVVVLWVLFANTAFYFLLRYPIGKYFQKKFLMHFDFAEPRIISIEKVEKKGILERNPVYFVRIATRAHHGAQLPEISERPKE